MNTAEIIASMQTCGWTVTFPAFGQTRTLAVRANKGDQEWTRGYLSGKEGSFDDAIQRLHEVTKQ